MTAILTFLIRMGVPERFARAAAIVLLVIVAILAIMIVSTIRSCGNDGAQQTQAKITTGQLGAFQNSAVDATNTVGAVNSNQSAAEDLTRRNTEEIQHAKGADTQLDPELNSAFVRAACRRASAAHDPKCRLLQPGP